MVTASPWGGSLAATALRFARAAVAEGHAVGPVYFRGEGVYQVLSGRQADPGSEDLSSAWRALAESQAFELLLCSADAARRLPPGPVTAPWREAGLGEWFGCLADADRVVSF